MSLLFCVSEVKVLDSILILSFNFLELGHMLHFLLETSLLNLLILDLLQRLSSSTITHELSENMLHLIKLMLSHMLKCSLKNSLFVLLHGKMFLPSSEVALGLIIIIPHEVVSNKSVSLVSSQLELLVDEVLLVDGLLLQLVDFFVGSSDVVCNFHGVLVE